MPPEQENDYIQLDQFLKLMNVVSSGGEAKHMIKEGVIKVNGDLETRRGRKLRQGDLVEIDGGEKFTVGVLSK